MGAFAGVLHHAGTAGQSLMNSNAGLSPSSASPKVHSGGSKAVTLQSSAANPSGKSLPTRQSVVGAQAASSTAGSSSSSATISANDFLTLLVTELQNQDPTAATDPNEYINQLVEVNSLEQLISINQDLSGLGSSTSTGSSISGPSSPTAGQAGTAPATGASTPGMGATASASSLTSAQAIGIHTAGSQVPTASGSAVTNAIGQFAQSVKARHAPGNLSLPAANPAAQRVAHALDGQARTRANPTTLP